jgi:hypothetical protein
MMQHHALTKMVCVMMHNFCREDCIQKVIMVIQSSEQKFEGATLKCCNWNSPQDTVQYQKRTDKSLDNGLKGSMIVIKI